MRSSAVSSWITLDAGAYGNFAPGPKKRQRHSATSNAEVAAATTIADLQAASKGLQNKGGADPFPAAMQVNILRPSTQACSRHCTAVSYRAHDPALPGRHTFLICIAKYMLRWPCGRVVHARTDCVCQAAGGQGSFAAALSAVEHGAGPSMTPGMADASGRTVGWDSPDPNQVCRRATTLSNAYPSVPAWPSGSWGFGMVS